jgi:hypothetical protein
VSGGSARADIELPVVESKSFGRTLTIAQTVRERLHQVLVKGAIALLLLLLLSETLMYHLTADSNGRILVRPGFPITHALVPVALVKETDTGMRVDQLSTSEPRGAEAIAQSRLWGFASHLDPHNIKPWFSQIAPLLKPAVRIRAEMLTVAAETRPLPEDSPPPLDETLFLSTLRNQRPVEAASGLYPKRSTDTVECTQGSTRKVDFPLLMVPTEPYSRDLKWQSLLARNDKAAALVTIETEIQNTAYRFRENTEGILADIWSLAFSLEALKPFIPASEDLRKTLVDKLDTPCKGHAAVALRIFGFGADSTRAESILLKDMHASDGETPDALPTASQTIAAYSLTVMAAAHPLNDSTIDALAAILVSTDPDLERTTLSRTVLVAAARRQPLPINLLDHLFTRLEGQPGEFKFGYLAALEILSNNLEFLPPHFAKRLGVWLDNNAARNYTFEEVHEAIGHLLSVDPSPRPQLIQLLADRLSPQTYFPVPALSYRGEPIISSTGDAAAVALGRAFQSRDLPKDTEERLVRFAIGRKDAVDRQIIIDGLAKQWYPGSLKPADIEWRVGSATGDSGRRMLEVDVACSRLVGTSSSSRDSAIAGLVSLWQRQSEPEVRNAIAQIVARSQWPRYGDITMCSGE